MKKGGGGGVWRWTRRYGGRGEEGGGGWNLRTMALDSLFHYWNRAFFQGQVHFVVVVVVVVVVAISIISISSPQPLRGGGGVGCRGTTDVLMIFLQPSLSSASLRVLARGSSVHSLMLSCQHFFGLPRLFPPLMKMRLTTLEDGPFVPS